MKFEKPRYTTTSWPYDFPIVIEFDKPKACGSFNVPSESRDLKTGGLEILEPCYRESNPSTGGFSDS